VELESIRREVLDVKESKMNENCFELVPVVFLSSLVLPKDKADESTVNNLLELLQTDDRVLESLIEFSTKLSNVLGSTVMFIPGAVSISSNPQEKLIAKYAIDFFLGGMNDDTGAGTESC